MQLGAPGFLRRKLRDRFFICYGCPAVSVKTLFCLGVRLKFRINCLRYSSCVFFLSFSPVPARSNSVWIIPLILWVGGQYMNSSNSWLSGKKEKKKQIFKLFLPVWVGSLDHDMDSQQTVPAYGVAWSWQWVVIHLRGERGRWSFWGCPCCQKHTCEKKRSVHNGAVTLWRKGLAVGMKALELINAGNFLKLGSARYTSTICCRNNRLFYCLWGWQKA